MNLAVAVEARFGTDGSIRPLAFVLDDALIRIASLGRQWEQDEEIHFLVMSADEKVYELAYHRGDCCWLIYRRPEDLGGRHSRV